MAKLLMLKGIPASGKSVYAKHLVLTEGWKRVNKDDLRGMIDAGQWSRANEEIIMVNEYAMVSSLLMIGENVVVDDTNFHPKHEAKYREIAEKWGAEFEIKEFKESPRVCIERDAGRVAPVGSKVIMDMYFKYAYPKTPEWSEDKQNTYIFDIDGTLAKMGDRSPFDWKKVGKDIVKSDISMIARILKTSGLPIILVSGRDASCKVQTKRWLARNFIPYDKLFMRTKDDNRKDTIIKKEIYENKIKPKYNVLAVFDDRDQVVDMWRAEGLTCLQVDYGAF